MAALQRNWEHRCDAGLDGILEVVLVGTTCKAVVLQQGLENRFCLCWVLQVDFASTKAGTTIWQHGWEGNWGQMGARIFRR